MNQGRADGEVQLALSRLVGDRRNESAWQTIYGRLQGFVFGVVYENLAGNASLARDVTQGIFVRLLLYADLSCFLSVGDLQEYLRERAHEEVELALTQGPLQWNVLYYASCVQRGALLHVGARDEAGVYLEPMRQQLVDWTLNRLSERERLVLICLTLELSAIEIANRLDIGQLEATADIHRLRIRLSDSNLAKFYMQFQ